jgi:hypothetical protein
MEIKNLKMTLIGMAALTVANTAWVYLYTLVGLNFTKIFDPVFFIGFMKDISWVPALLLTGFLIAVSIFIARFFSAYISKPERLLMLLVGVIVPMAIGLVLYSNLLIFIIVMLFYLLGCVLAIGLADTEIKGLFSKFGSGYNVTKTVLNIVAIGSIVASLLFFYTNLEDSQAKFKEGILSIQSQINLGSFLSKDDIRGMIMSSGSVMTVDQIKELLITQAATASGVSADMIRANPAIMSMIDGNATVIYDNQIQSLDAQVDRAYDQITNSSSSTIRPLLESMLSKPPMKYIIDFMPVISAIIVASFISLFSMVWVSPMGSLIGVLMPKREEQKK